MRTDQTGGGELIEVMGRSLFVCAWVLQLSAEFDPSARPLRFRFRYYQPSPNWQQYGVRDLRAWSAHGADK